MKIAVPFPWIEQGNDYKDIIRVYSGFKDRIDYFYFRIPLLEGRGSSEANRYYAEQCLGFISETKGMFRSVLDYRPACPRNMTNRYYRHHVADIISGYGFDGIMAQHIGNAAYISDKIDVYLYACGMAERELACMLGRCRVKGVIAGDRRQLDILKGFIEVSRQYIVNEGCSEGCRVRGVLYSDRAGLDGFCKRCEVAREDFFPKFILPEQARRVKEIDTAVISGALRESAWINNVCFAYLGGIRKSALEVVNGIGADRK